MLAILTGVSVIACARRSTPAPAPSPSSSAIRGQDASPASSVPSKGASCAAEPGPGPGPTPASLRTRPPSAAPIDANAIPIKAIDDECTTPADCKTGRHGRCVRRETGGPTVDRIGERLAYQGIHNQCIYDECESDAECRASGIFGDYPRPNEIVCSCRAPSDVDGRNVCALGNCVTDGDCQSPYRCEGGKNRFCHSSKDDCQRHADCGGKKACRHDLSATPPRYTCNFLLQIDEPEGKVRMPVGD